MDEIESYSSCKWDVTESYKSVQRKEIKGEVNTPGHEML